MNLDAGLEVQDKGGELARFLHSSSALLHCIVREVFGPHYISCISCRAGTIASPRVLSSLYKNASFICTAIEAL
jgi:hypothetical protein